jgi:hypothetical protein
MGEGTPSILHMSSYELHMKRQNRIVDTGSIIGIETTCRVVDGVEVGDS